MTGPVPQTMAALPVLPSSFGATREALRAVACYVIAPARKARTGRIGLRPAGDGFGTPAFDDGSRLVVRADRLGWEPGDSIALTTVRAAAAFAAVDLSADPGVGRDLPPYEPDAALAVDPAASMALGAWYRFGQEILERLPARGASISAAQLWPEHFDLAVTATVEGGEPVNVGFSPGDSFSDVPYVYVGPHATTGLGGGYWNAPFGAYLTHAELAAAPDPRRAACRFIAEGLALAARPGRRTVQP